MAAGERSRWSRFRGRGDCGGRWVRRRRVPGRPPGADEAALDAERLGGLNACRPRSETGVTGCRAIVELPLVAGGDDEDTRRISWYWVAAWTGFGVALLGVAGALERGWKWTGGSIDVMVHVGATLLLAPLLPFLEKSLTHPGGPGEQAHGPAGDSRTQGAGGFAGNPHRPTPEACR